jgi:RNA polymerase sigma-70 factor (ECF subfamily)
MAPVIATIESIYRQHRGGLFTLALSITGRAESAEDAVHEAIVRLCRAGKTPGGDPVAYVFAAVRNAAIDQKRRLGGVDASAVSIFDVAEPSQAPDNTLHDGERDKMMADAIDQLPADQRDALVMHVFSGLTLQQAATALGVPLQTLASRYRRALARLRESLASLR